MPSTPTPASSLPLPDTTQVHVVGNTMWKALLIGKAAGTTKGIVMAAGLSDTISVVVQ